MEYKLINKIGETYLCNKVTIDGFDYYVSDEAIEEGWKGIAYKKDVTGEIFKHFYTTNEWYNDAKKVIATNNPNIDCPKVVVDDELTIHTNNHFKDYWKKEDGSEMKRYEISSSMMTNMLCEVSAFMSGYNKAKETYSNYDEDMTEFAEWINKNKFLQYADKLWSSSLIEYSGCLYSTKELLQLWKSQKPKTIWYE